MVLARPRVNNWPHNSNVILEERKNNLLNKTKVNTNEPPGALENASDSVGFRFDSNW